MNAVSERLAVPLIGGSVAWISPDDAELVLRYRWRETNNKNTTYARTDVWSQGCCTTYLMHRLILGLQPGDKRQADHVDRNGLNNTRSNLRLASAGENTRNRAGWASSGLKGAHARPDGTFESSIFRGGQKTHLGTFGTAEEAAQAYAAAVKQHGAFGCIAHRGGVQASDDALERAAAKIRERGR